MHYDTHIDAKQNNIYKNDIHYNAPLSIMTNMLILILNTLYKMTLSMTNWIERLGIITHNIMISCILTFGIKAIAISV